MLLAMAFIPQPNLLDYGHSQARIDCKCWVVNLLTMVLNLTRMGWYIPYNRFHTQQ